MEDSKPHQELEPVLTTPPKDCTGDCGYGPCNCSGEWQVQGYTKESVERLVEQLEAAREALRRIAFHSGIPTEGAYGERIGPEVDMRTIARNAYDSIVHRG